MIKSKLKRFGLVAAVLPVLFLATACPGDSTPQSANQQARNAVQAKNKELKAPEINNNVEYNNYYKAQTTYDDPQTILWCSTTWGNASAPLVTVPVAGKLTSSSVSLFPSQQVRIDTDTPGSYYYPELPSVDSMFHGSPPPYRYGFTPGGQYVDFFNMPTFCTTSLTSFQRQSTKVTLEVDKQMANAQETAERALAACIAAKKDNCPAAQDALEGGLG